MLRVIFMGTPEFAVPSLEAILRAGHDVPLVVTAPDRPKGRGLKTAPSDVRIAAERHGLSVVTPESLKDPALHEQVREAQPDVICVVAFRILPESLYTIPRRGSFNLHASLLPKYRGAAPINWAIINGEQETGVTTFFLQRKVDTGATILQRRVPIGPDTTAGELHDRLMEVGAEAVVETLRAIERNSVEPVAQDDAEASPAPKIYREDCRIDWAQHSTRVHDFVRGLSPFPGAWTCRGSSLLKILRTRTAERDTVPEGLPRELTPGRLCSNKQRLFIGTGRNLLEILQLQPEGRRAMAADEYLRGYPVSTEEPLT